MSLLLHHTQNFVNGVKQTLKFDKVYYAPGLTKTLISTAKLTKKGFKVIVNSEGGQVINWQGWTVLSSIAQDGVLVISFKPIKDDQVNAICKAADLDNLHRRFGHVGKSGLRILLKNEGVSILNGRLSLCEVCRKGKQRRKPISKGPTDRSSTPHLNVLHSDIAGPFPPSA